jgi:hypothetical protein
LLADRAQYITGASGAAIALRRSGKNDMLCRASAGENAPELGALLSTEFGLSGESVRTRQPLRCDDAERDARVNRDVCRQMGIASVVVMPVVNDDEVLGVFELFSGKANAFGVRDVSAVQRLSEMVETAVRLAQATESLPERLKMQQASPALAKEADVLEDQDLVGQVLEDTVLEDRVLEESVLEKPAPRVRVATEKKPQDAGSPVTKVGARAEKPHVEVKVPAPSPESGQVLGQKAIARPAPTVEKTAAPRKPLFWSAALSPAADTGKTEETDQSHVPPVLRSLRKCDACGFPVSAGRALCVECEEKKWRGQLKASKAAPTPAVASSPAIAVAFAAAAPTAGGGAVAPPSDAGTASVAISPAIKERKEGVEPVAAAPVLGTTVVERAAKPVVPEASTGAFVLSAGLEPSQSWIARNKYVLGALLVIGVAAAAVFLLR